ncbi:hypothetical protein JAAARDRAFT_196687 [Jaapia argillacea MUCL 33604]|uniref:Uncharacterized protein n=1 Tax=Jaapia argillacea MUCL 33604 TaxID=933084 RepID=A0A067PHE5_9AGAM|nr:hypothetical protein JAAARDRAFT_196687 [Jaapia argillacea MUCL 33604]
MGPQLVITVAVDVDNSIKIAVPATNAPATPSGLRRQARYLASFLTSQNRHRTASIKFLPRSPTLSLTDMLQLTRRRDGLTSHKNPHQRVLMINFYRILWTASGIAALLYGAYLPLFLGSAYVCTYVRLNKYLLALATVMFALCTVEVVLDFAMELYTPEIVANSICTRGVCLGCDGDTESRIHQADIDYLLRVGVNAVGVVNQLMADGLLIYRTFVLWKPRFWVVIIPIATLMGTVVCGLLYVYFFLQTYFIQLRAPLSETTPPPKWMNFAALQLTVLTTEDALITTMNILTTALGTRRESNEETPLGFDDDSCGIYTMAIIIHVLCDYLDPVEFSAVVEVILIQLTGITPTLLIIMLGLGKSVDHTPFRYSDVINIDPPVSQPLEVGSPVPLSDSIGAVD